MQDFFIIPQKEPVALRKKEEVEYEPEVKENIPMEFHKKLRNFQKMRDCSHIWVKIPLERGDLFQRHGCIKCGLDSGYQYSFGLSDKNPASLMPIAYAINSGGIQIDAECSLKLAQEIYQEILRVHPNIDDDLVIQYFFEAYHILETQEHKEDVRYR